MAKFLVVLVTFSFTQAASQSVDQTVISGTSGANVVRSVISKLDAASIFEVSGNADLTNVFMRNMAYVETRDGTSYPDGNMDGGIWKLSRSKFHQTQMLHSDFPGVFDAIRMAFGIEWQTLDYGELTKPLYSGLAVRLYLEYIASNIPPTTRHALFWMVHFKEGASVHTWLAAIEMLSENEVCSIDTDVVFVLDSSGSIGPDNYTKVLNFTRDFVTALLEDSYRKDSGEGMGSRVGIVIFSTSAETRLLLNETQSLDQNSLVELIEDIPYLSQLTSTADGLCHAIEQPWRDSLSVLRLVITLTDGRSNVNSSRCGSVEEAADFVHSNDPKLISYVIGVANIYIEELLRIASAPELVDHLESFDTDLLTAAQEARTYQICFTVNQPIEVGQLEEGTLKEGNSVRISLEAPAEEGITVRFCVIRGKIALYASTSIPNPSAALHEWVDIITAADNQHPIRCQTTFYDLNRPDINQANIIGKREVEEMIIVTLYISIEGQESLNEFQLNSSYGGDENECRGRPCHANAVCQDTVGSFTCTCTSGYIGDGQVVCLSNGIVALIVVLLSLVGALLVSLLTVLFVKLKAIGMLAKKETAKVAPLEENRVEAIQIKAREKS